VSGQGRVREVLGQVKERVLDAQKHQDLTFEQVVELVKAPRSPSHTPIFQVILAWQNNDESSLDLPGLTVSSANMAYNAVEFDLELDLKERGNRASPALLAELTEEPTEVVL
jgi:non-ribosomal peptide synthetase component F